MHHCGAGTTHAALSAGKPTVPVPFITDQPFWATQLRRHGAATAPLNRKRLSAAGVRAAVEQAESCAAPAEAAGRRERAQPDGVGQAIQAIERMLVAG